MRFVVTGGAGFMGCHLVRRLLNEGADVQILDRCDGIPSPLDDLRTKILLHDIDITNKEDVMRIVKDIKPTHIIHLAAIVNAARPERMLHRAIEVNIGGTLNTLEASRAVGCSSFVFVSTSDVYGPAATPFKEDAPLDPRNPYAFTKASSELLCLMANHTNGQPVTIVRPFTTYGPGQKPFMLVTHVITNALMDSSIKTTAGAQCREINYVDDIVDGLVRAAVTPKAIGQIINLGCGIELPVLSIVRRIVEMCGKDQSLIDATMPYRDDEVWHMRADNSKARDLLGWSPKVSIEDGLKMTIDWYKEHR
jgi:nucleoside-diphosphate-sugar epimerase